MKYLTFLLFIVTLLITSQPTFSQSSITATYSAGDIPTSFSVYDPTCNGPVTPLSITLPSTPGYYEVVGIDITYDMTALGGGWMVDQRSQVYCQNTTNLESAVYSGAGNMGGTQSYSRLNVDIANGVYNPSDILTFEMHDWRVFGGAGCNSTFNKVDDGTWMITVYYVLCSPFDVFLYNQVDVDDFVANYGDCNTISGSLGIGPDVSDISGLNFLTYINGHLEIIKSQLTSLSGLDNITSIVGDLVVEENNNLLSLIGLNNLSDVNEIFIEDNFALTSLSGLDNLSIYPSINIVSNGLTSLTGLNYITLMGNLVIENNYSLTSLSGLDNATTIGYLVIENNGVLTSLTALDNVTSIEDLNITSNVSLTSLTGLGNVTSIDGDLNITSNASLTSLTGLGNVTSIDGDLNITSNVSLITISALNNITSFGGSIGINNNSALTTLIGLDNANIIVGDLSIHNNDALTTLIGLDNIGFIDGDFDITDNSLLDSINNIANLKILNGGLTLRNNNSLEDCCIVSFLNSNIKDHIIDISNNASGCQSMIDIVSTCESTDQDQDGLSNTNDNCPNNYNPKQEDQDNDNIGNACDNCPLLANTPQLDANNNFIGDACEVAEPGKAGVNTTTPKSGLEISASELYLSDTQRGLIMTNALGDCFRIHIDLDGKLQSIPIDCPN